MIYSRTFVGRYPPAKLRRLVAAATAAIVVSVTGPAGAATPTSGTVPVLPTVTTALPVTTPTTLAPTTTTTAAPLVSGRTKGDTDDPHEGTTTPHEGTTTPHEAATPAATTPTTTTTSGGFSTPPPAQLDPRFGYTGGGEVTGNNPLLSTGAEQGNTNRAEGLAPIVLLPRADLDAAVAALADSEADLLAKQDNCQRATAALAATRRDLAHLDAAIAGAEQVLLEAQGKLAVARAELTETAVALFRAGREMPNVLAELSDVKGATKRAAAKVTTDSAVDAQVQAVRERAADRAAAQVQLNTLLSQKPGALASLAAANASSVTATAQRETARQRNDAALRKAAILRSQSAPALAAVAGFTHLVDLRSTFPIAGVWEFEDTWGYPRSGGRTHKGTDVFCASGTPLVAIEAGRAWVDGDNLGGLVVYIEGSTGALYYYAHLASVPIGVRAAGSAGRGVEAGEIVGFCGNSGNAFDTPAHLHIQVAPPGRDWVNPYPLLQTLSAAVANVQSFNATNEQALSATVPPSVTPSVTTTATAATETTAAAKG